MKRSKRHRVKQEIPDASTSRASEHKEHDLAYYIHDRVELLHQVFSVLKPKELKAMAPECVRHISINDLQELCMEELLGISSKRLCAILDGAEPPSDTESSSESPGPLETISLDSISSDDEILSQVSSKKSKKHKHRSKSKSKKRKSKDSSDKQQEERSRRAGLTMLELLELQARARAIRAQLHKEQAMAASTEKPVEAAASTAASVSESTDDEVEIKEEAAEVVEISSEDEKPNVQELDERISATRNESESNPTPNSSGTITKKVNDLVITVPQAKSSRKIKLKRNTSSNTKDKVVEKDKNVPTTSTEMTADTSSTIRKDTNNITKTATEEVVAKRSETKTIELVTDNKDKAKGKEKKKKRKKDKQKEKEGSDHDEITLQLSDTEKMDLLEDLEGNKFEKSSETEDSSEDSDSGSSSDDNNEEQDKCNSKTVSKAKVTSKEAREKVKESKSVEKSDLSKEKSVKSGTQDEIQSVESSTGKDKEIYSNTNNGANKDAKELDLGITNTNESRTEVTIDESNVNPEGTDKNSVQQSSIINIIADTEEETLQFADNAIEVNTISDIPLETSNDDKIENLDENSVVLQKDSTEGNDDDAKEQRNNVREEIQSNIEITIENDKPTDNLANVEPQTDKDTSSVQNKDDVLPNTDTNKIETEINIQKEDENRNKEDSKDKSEGELSDRDSSEVEASDVKSEVVCISDEEEKKSKKKKKKDKKSKKEKKSKKNKDFRESADQNFYTQTKDDEKDNCENKDDAEITEVTEKVDSNKIDVAKDNNCIDIEDKSQDGDVVLIPENSNDDTKAIKTEASPKSIHSNTDIDDDVYEILELSDDSSCYEVEEISISKEPTTEEIEALSAKLDEIERDRSININEIDRDRDTDKDAEDVNTEDLENVSWKDRYLKSTKVKRVLTTANLLNAIRKKNLDLKKKLKDSKKETTEEEVNTEKEASNVLEEGSIQHYNTLEASTRYVDPIKEIEINDNSLEKSNSNENTDKGAENTNSNKELNENEDATDKEVSTDAKDSAEKGTATKEMKKEAKQLLKMYKMLLKYNDITKRKDPSKKKKKKKDKKKDKSSSQASVAT